MKSRKKHFLMSLITVIVLVIALSGCGKGTSEDNQSGDKQETSSAASTDVKSDSDATASDVAVDDKTEASTISDEKVELSWNCAWPEEACKSFFNDNLKEKFPNFTFKYVQKIEPEMVASGNLPDIIFIANHEHIYDDVELGMLEDLTPMVDASDLDLGTFDQSTIETTKTGYKGKLYALPWQRGTSPVLYINTEVFDKFNVPYPDKTKPMTWDETIDLARKLTGKIDGVQYRGIDLQNPGYILDSKVPLELDENNQPLYQKDPIFRQFFEYLQRFWSIPGIWPEGSDPTKVVHVDYADAFAKNKNIAMLILWNSDQGLEDAEKENGLKWDYRPFPVWPDSPKTGPVGYVNVQGISSNSKHKEAAFEVLKYLWSDEFQMNMAKQGTIPLSTKPEIEQAAIDALRSRFSGKSVESMFALTPAIPHMYAEPKYKKAAVGTWGVVEQFTKLDKDINTVLREMDEETIKNIDKMKAEGK